MTIPDPQTTPTVPFWPVAGRALSLGKSTGLELARRAANGERDVLPVRVFRVGRRYLVATAELRRVLALDNPADSESEAAGRSPTARRS
jgi:hypothetical protein